MRYLKRFFFCLALMAPFGLSARELLPQESATENFYRWYMGQLVAMKAPLIDGDKASLNKYLSASLIEKLKQLTRRNLIDHDYFTKAQDFPDAWAKNISVQSTDSLGDEATVLVTLTDVDMSTQVAVQLKKVAGQWKILYVLNLNRP